MFDADNSTTAKEVKLNFDKLPSNCPRPNLTEDQKRVIENKLTQLQSIIHYIFWSKARFNARDGYTFLTVLTGNKIFLFADASFKFKSLRSMNDHQKSKSKEKIKIESNARQDYTNKIKWFRTIDLEELKQIGYDLKSKEVLIRAQLKQDETNDVSESGKKTSEDKKINIQYLVDKENGFNLAFAQCVYRNFYFNFSVLGKGEFVEVLTDSNEFPILNVHLSPSQCFQFFYHANCSKENFEYSQQIVQYIHSLVLLGMPIVDISKLPLFSQKSSAEKKNILKPVFRALSDQDFVCGICCSDKNPDLMDSINLVFHKSSKINLIHLENCGMKNGIKNLRRKVQKYGSNICYWNLRQNSFTDIKDFIGILEDSRSTENLLFLDLSYCNLDDEFMEKLYTALIKYKKLQQLYVAGSSNKSKSVTEAFDNLLTQYESHGRINLRTLDLSEIDSVDSYLKVLNKHKIHLRSLKLRKVDLISASTDLKKFISRSSTLRSLDLSEIEHKGRYLEEVLSTLYDNEKLTNFDLILNKLKNRKIVPIISALIKGPTLETKWNSLHLDSNNLSGEDIKNITPLLKMMNVSFLSLNDNFSYDPDKKDNENIGEILCDLINECDFLQKLHIRGKNKHTLGPKITEVLKEITSSEIREIDFRDNKAGDDFYLTLQNVIKARNKEDDNESIPLSHISIDGNNLSLPETLENISKLIDQKKILKFDFPEEDCKAILKDSKDQKILEQISNAKVAIVSAVHKNRASRRLFPDLPFETTKEMRNLIQGMTKEIRERIINEGPLTHTEFCEELGLPLPFQNMGDVITEGGKEVTDEENNNFCQAYHSNTLSKYIEENDQYGLLSQKDQEFKADYFNEEEETDFYDYDKIEEEEEEGQEEDKNEQKAAEEERRRREEEEEEMERERRRKEEEEEMERERRLKEEEEEEMERERERRRREEEEEEREREREKERKRKEKERKRRLKEEEEEAERRRFEEEEEEKERERRRKRKEKKKREAEKRRRLEEEEAAERRRIEEEEEERERERRRKRKEKKKREAERRRREEEEEELERRRKEREERKRKKEEAEKRKRSSSKRRSEDFGFSNSDDNSDDQYSPTKSHKKGHNNQENDDDINENMENDDQEKQMNDDMNNLVITSTSRNFKNFTIPNFSKSQKGINKQNSPQDSLYISQRRPNLKP